MNHFIAAGVVGDAASLETEPTASLPPTKHFHRVLAEHTSFALRAAVSGPWGLSRRA
jgi:hypothetical protein